MRDTISISAITAAALSTIGIGDFYTVNTPERMAWAVLILRELPDRPEWFAAGQWATIQHIERQLAASARLTAEALASGIDPL
jgi:hypothetical protein